MEQVKQMILAGVSIPTAIKETLAQNGLTVTAFAEKYDLGLSTVRNAIAGVMRADEGTIRALVAEFGGEADDWAELLWFASKPPSAPQKLSLVA